MKKFCSSVARILKILFTGGVFGRDGWRAPAPALRRPSRWSSGTEGLRAASGGAPGLAGSDAGYFALIVPCPPLPPRVHFPSYVRGNTRGTAVD